MSRPLWKFPSLSRLPVWLSPNLTEILATLAPDWQLTVAAILAIVHWDTGFRATTGPSMAAAPWGQSGNCQSGSEWHHTLALATLATADCTLCGTWHHCGSFIVKMVWGCTAVSFFLFCHFYQNYLFYCFLDGSMWFLLFLAPLC